MNAEPLTQPLIYLMKIIGIGVLAVAVVSWAVWFASAMWDARK